jgi:putative transposase
MAKEKRAAFSAQPVDELQEGQDPATVLQPNGLLGEVNKALAERMLNTGMDEHHSGPSTQEKKPLTRDQESAIIP